MATASPNSAPQKGFMGWLNKRLPVQAFYESQMAGYLAPKNMNFCISSARSP